MHQLLSIRSVTTRVVLLSAIGSTLGTTVCAQSRDELATIMTGWSRGAFEAIVSSRHDPATNTWELFAERERWRVESLGPARGRFFSDDNEEAPFEFFVELGAGTYTTYVLDEAGARTNVVEHRLLEANVFGPDHWTILVAWARGDDSPQTYAEMYMAGNLFVRTDFIDVPETGKRRRTQFSSFRRLN